MPSCVSPNLRMCLILGGINGAMIAVITSLDLQTQPCCVTKGKLNLPLSSNILQKREGGIHKK